MLHVATFVKHLLLLYHCSTYTISCVLCVCLFHSWDIAVYCLYIHIIHTLVSVCIPYLYATLLFCCPSSQWPPVFSYLTKKMHLPMKVIQRLQVIYPPKSLLGNFTPLQLDPRGYCDDSRVYQVFVLCVSQISKAACTCTESDVWDQTVMHRLHCLRLAAVIKSFLDCSHACTHQIFP